MSIDPTLQRYIDELPKALLNFQFLEEALKQYLRRCYFMIASVVRPFVPYSVAPAERLEKLSLGRLIKLFRDLNENEELIGKLLEFPRKRNFIAHQAYVAVSSNSDPTSLVDTAYADLQETIHVSEECLSQLWSEIRELEERFVTFHQEAQSSHPGSRSA